MVAGFIDSLTHAKIIGWACSQSVKLIIDNNDFGFHKCTVSRPDVVNAGFEAGRGFEIDLTHFALSPGAHIVEIWADGDEVSKLRNGVQGTSSSVFIPHPSTIDLDRLLSVVDEMAKHATTRRLLLSIPELKYRPEKLDIDFIFVDGLPGSQSTRYRIFNIVDELIARGFDCAILTEDELWRITQGYYRARRVIFFRCPCVSTYEEAMIAARRAGAIIQSDFDDLVFDRSVMPQIDGVRFLPSDEVARYGEGMEFYAKMIEVSDYVTASTASLAREMSQYNSNAGVIVNSISRKYLSVNFKNTENGPFRIGYYSGTKTHQTDFHAAYKAIVHILNNNPGVLFRVAGELELSEFPLLQPFADRIEIEPLRPHEEMLHSVKECSITIAPLEVGNRYCEAKSELKYFESAFLGVPVVASPTEPFRASIRHGVNGYLAATENEWATAIQRAIDDPNKLKSVADAAQKHVIESFGSQNACEQFLALEETVGNFVAMQAAPSTPRRPIFGPARKSFGFVVPPVHIGSGGHRKIFKICSDLSKNGHDVSIYVLGERSSTESKELIDIFFYPFSGRVFRYNGSVMPHDYLVASSWDSAYVVRRHQALAKECAYFVQDFEPMFMPVGTEYLKALATYTFGFKIICFGHWVAERLKKEFNLNCPVIPFTLSHSTYHDGGSQRQSGSILLFARPSQERRAFALARDALKIVSRIKPGVSISFYGEAEYEVPPFDYTNYGLIKEPRALGELYRRMDVGICLSSTNPSLVGYEMVASGCSLVDLQIPDCDVNFMHADVVYRARPTEDDLATAICSALTESEVKKARKSAGLNFANGMPEDSDLVNLFCESLGIKC